MRVVSPGYVRALGVAMRDGRDVSATDGATAPSVVVVNETLARRLTPAGSPVGRDVRFGVPAFNGTDGQRVWRVVGVAADTCDKGPREAVTPEVFIPIAQTPAEIFFWISRELQLAVRTSGDPQTLAPDVRRVVATVDPAISLGRARTLDDRVAESFARERLLARLLAGLGLAGVTLALLGLFAVVHNQVHRRRRDIAIRLALGATSPGVVGALVKDGAQLATIGVFCRRRGQRGYGRTAGVAALRRSAGRPAHARDGDGACRRSRRARRMGAGTECRGNRSGRDPAHLESP